MRGVPKNWLQVHRFPDRSRLDRLSFEGEPHGLAIDARHHGVYENHRQPTRGATASVIQFRHEGDPWEITQHRAIALEDRASTGYPFLQHLQLSASDGGTDIAESIVVAHLQVLVMRSRLPSLSGPFARPGDELGVVRSQDTAPGAGDDLVAVEGIGCGTCALASRPALVARADGFRRITDHRDAVVSADLNDGVEIA